MTSAYGIPVSTLTNEAYETFRAKETEEKTVKNGQVALPQLFLTAEEPDQITGFNVGILAYVEQMEAK